MENSGYIHTDTHTQDVEKIIWINLDFRREVLMGKVHLKQINVWVCEGTRVSTTVYSVRYE